MNFDITQIAVALIGLAGVVITSVIVPYLKSKTTETQWEMIMKYAYAGVQAAEILKIDDIIVDKRDFVIDYITGLCKQNNIKVDDEQIRVALENAWKGLGLDIKELPDYK